MKITSGKIPSAKKVVVYGPEGIGKSTFLSNFPDPVFIDTEGSTKELDVKRLPMPTSWAMLKEEIQYVINTPGICKTLAIDTADWAEQLCAAEICAAAKKDSIESFGYGKGIVYLAEEFGRMLNMLNDVIDRGIHVVIAAHAQMRKFEQPDEFGAYDRWEMKLQKKTAPLVKEWADVVLFANYKTLVVAVDDNGSKHKAQGGKRVMYTSHHACWDAKNRYGLKDELDFDYREIAHLLRENIVKDSNNVIEKEKVVTTTTTAQEQDNAKKSETSKPQESTNSTKYRPIPDTITPDNCPQEIILAMRDLAALTNAAGISRDEIKHIVEQRGYFPKDTPIPNYGEEFIRGMLIRNWDNIKESIIASRECGEVFGGMNHE